MRVFVTGATGFIGSAIVRELLGVGHQVLGLARSDAAAKSLAEIGADAHRGHLEDLECLRVGAARCDGAIHTAFIHDFSQYQASGEIDLRAVEAIGAALEDTGRPFVNTSGTAFSAFVSPGRSATEDDEPPVTLPRIASEVATIALASRGVRATVVRLPPSVHGEVRAGFVSLLIETAREKGVSAYVGDGHNRWPAVHQLDAAHLFCLAFENGAAGARYHGVGDEGVPLRDIAEIIGRRLDVPIAAISPDEAAGHFGFVGLFAGRDCPASSALTQERLRWRPTHPGLIADLDSARYFPA